MKFSWDFILIFVTLGALIPWRGSVRIRRLLALPRFTASDRLVTYASTVAFQWLLTAIVAWRAYVRGITAENLGLVIHSPSMTALVAAGLVLALSALQYVGIRQTALLPATSYSRLREISLRLMPRTLVEALAFSALAGTASLCEEFLYRGFVFAVLLLTSGSAVIAIVGSSLMFGLAHLYQGRRGLITTCVLGLIFAACRFWVGNLIPVIAGHLAVDLLAGYVAPHYLHRSIANAAEVVTVGSGELRK
jgi:membrane protease YdiL (CAAX protease family)